MLRTLDFALKQAAVNIRRHAMMSLAATSTVAMALCLVGAAGLFLFNLNRWTRRVVGEVEVYVYVRRSLTRAEALALEHRIQALPQVAQTTFIPREQAYRELQQDLGHNPALFRGLPNPLPDAVRVRTHAVNQVAQVARIVAQWPQVEDVVHAHQTVALLVALRRIVTVGSAAIGALLVLAAVLIIHNTIRLTLLARRREIGIMQLVGATPYFVAAPFMLEGAFHGVAGALIAFALLIPAYAYAYQVFGRSFALFPLAPPSVLLDCGMLLVAGGLLIAAAGSAISLRRFLRGYHPS